MAPRTTAHDAYHEKTAELTATPDQIYDLENPENEDVEMDEKEKKRILRKLDLRIVPYVTLLYLVSFLDRVNIGQARVAGMQRDLALTNGQYQIALIIFFVSYVAVEVPSNLALKILKPNLWIWGNMVIWGGVVVAMGFVKTPGQLYATRFLLGLFEGGLFPGLNLMLTFFYTREELGKRVAVFFAGATLAGAFGGLLAYGIRQMDGIGGLEGWRWIFILEGIATVVIALPAFHLIQDFPAKAKVLNQGNDRKKWLHHLAKSQGITNAETPFSWEHVMRGIKNWKTWVFAVMYLSIAEPFYSSSLFLPSIISALGYTGPKANLFSAFPFFVGFTTTLIACWWSDRVRKRAVFIIGVMSLNIIGYLMLIAQRKPAVSYAGCFLAIAGVSPGIALAISHVGGQFGPVTTRAAAMGIFFSFGNSAGIISSVAYPSNTAPRYIMGHSLAIAFSALAIACAATLMFANSRENKRRDEVYGPVEPGSNPLYADEAQLARWQLLGKSRAEILDLGDKHPGFRYLV